MVHTDKYDKNRVQHLLEQSRGARTRPGTEDRRQMSPTRSAAAVLGCSAGLTIEPDSSRGAVSGQSVRTNRADEEASRYKLGCNSIVTQNHVCDFRTISPGVCETNPQPRE